MVLVSQIHSSLSATPSSASVAHQPAHMIANVFMCGGDLAVYVCNNLMQFLPTVCCGTVRVFDRIKTLSYNCIRVHNILQLY